MMNEFENLRQFNEVWDNRKLFTACIEMMLWYRLEDTIDGEQGQAALLHTYQNMTGAIRERANYFSKDESSKRRKIKKDSYDLMPYAMSLARKDDVGPTNQITFIQGGEYDKPDVFFDMHQTECGYIRFGLSMEEVIDAPQKYLALCLNAVGELKFQSGIAGFSMNYEDVYINGQENLTLPIIGRFKGVNVSHPWRYRSLDGIPTVNWLTFVNTEALTHLGGLSALQSRISGGVRIHPVKHGAVFQAGPRPLMGDVNLQENMADYFQVGQLLAPAKSTLEIQSKIAGSRAETEVWMHRFFQAAK
jgi:hypothetical protein